MIFLIFCNQKNSFNNKIRFRRGEIRHWVAKEAPSLHRLADDGFPLFRIGFANVTQVYFMMLAGSLPVACLNKTVKFFNGRPLFREWPDVHNLRALPFLP